ncbi:MAG: DUF4350 domain-containing protein [Promethearchaeota archaeon]
MTTSQKKPPLSLKKKRKKPPRIPVKKPPPPPIKKKGHGKIWMGIALIIAGIVVIIIFYGSLYPLLGGILILTGIYSLYKGFTDVDKILTSETIKIGRKTKTKMVYKKKKTLNKGAIFLFVVFIFFSLPILLTIFQIGNYASQPYSIFNETDGGCSIFREDLESNGYEVSAIISSYAEISKFPSDYPLNRTILFILGSKAIFFPTGLVYLQSILDAGGVVIMAQDEGTANEGLMFLGLYSTINLAFGGLSYANPMDLPFRDGYLCEGGPGSETAAIEVSLSLGGPSYNVLMWTAAPINGGTTLFNTLDQTADNVWLDLNKNLQQDPEDVTQVGGYSVTAVSQSGNLYLISDPDVFINKLMLESAYDNRAFASALVNSIPGVDNTWKIIFDEIHQIKRGYSSSFYFGLIIGIEDFLLLSWLFAPLGPYFAFRMVKKFIPQAEKPEKAKLSVIKREGVSLYSKRLDWFKRRHRYEKAVTLLYRRLKRSLTKILQLKGFNIDESIERLLTNYPEGEIDEKRLVEAFKTFESVEKGRRVYYKDEFLKIFLEMRWVADIAAYK